jgi:hypothetical protein
MEELNLRWANFKWVFHTLAASHKPEMVMTLQKLFEQLNNLVHAIREEET